LKSRDWKQTNRDDEAVRFAIACYRNALAALDRLPPESYVIIRYEDLVASPRGAVEQIYRQFGIPLSPAFAEVLEAEERKASNYRSRHTYTPEQFGLTHQQIEAMVPFVYDRFGYPRHNK